MKFVKVLMLGAVAALSLSGCEAEEYQPRLDFWPDGWSWNNTCIMLPYGTDLDYGHMYDMIETKDGFDMTIHFKTEGEK